MVASSHRTIAGLLRVKLQIVVRSHVLDAELNNVQTRIGSQLQFAQDLWGIIRIRRENQHDGFAFLDRACDLARKRATELHRGSDPTAGSPPFLEVAQTVIGDRFVFRRMGDENVVRHGIPDGSFLSSWRVSGNVVSALGLVGVQRTHAFAVTPHDRCGGFCFVVIRALVTRAADARVRISKFRPFVA